PFAFFFNPPHPSQTYTLSLHDALPISVPHLRATDARRDEEPVGPHAHLGRQQRRRRGGRRRADAADGARDRRLRQHPRARGVLRDRKSTRLNSSHVEISYAVFCLKKKK